MGANPYRGRELLDVAIDRAVKRHDDEAIGELQAVGRAVDASAEVVRFVLDRGRITTLSPDDWQELLALAFKAAGV